MKKAVFLTVLLLSVSCLLCGCLPEIMFIPDENSIGKSKKFEKDGFSIMLTDKFTEKESQRGFYAYYEAEFCGVVVLREEFTVEKGLAEKPLEDYITNVIANNGYTNIDPQTKDGLWFYERTNDVTFLRSYCYKGSDSFWIVQFLCYPSDAQSLKDFYLWAQDVQVK